MFVILLSAHVSQSMKQIFEFFQIPQTETLNVERVLSNIVLINWA